MARELRKLPTLPADPSNPQEPWTKVASGVKLPAVHCAFRGCIWKSSSSEALSEHLKAQHGEVFLRILGEDASGYEMDFYSEAIACIEREHVPVVGFSVDRRTFSHVAECFSDEHIVARICLVCAEVKTDTGHHNSAIEMRAGAWLKSVPIATLRESMDYGRYQARFGKGVAPLRGAGLPEAMIFRDWMLRWDESEADVPITATGETLKLICCPEDLGGTRGYPQQQRICSSCRFRLAAAAGLLSTPKMSYQRLWATTFAHVGTLWTCQLVGQIASRRFEDIC